MFLRHSSISSILRHYTAKPRRRLTHAQSSSWLGAAGLEVRREPRDSAQIHGWEQARQKPASAALFTHFPQAPFDQNHPSNSWGAKLERFFDRGFKTPALHLLENLRGLRAAGKERAVFTHNLRELGAAICACWG